MDQEQYANIQQALQKGKLSEALDLLVIAAEQRDQSLKADLLVLKSRFEYTRNQYELKGVMTAQDFNIQFSKTALGAQEILDRLQRGPEAPGAANSKKKSIYPILLSLVGILALFVAGWLLWPDASASTAVADQVTDSTTVNPLPKQDSEAGTITTEPTREPRASPGATHTAATPPPVSTELAKAVDRAPAAVAEEVEKAADTPPAQTFEVNIIRNSNLSDADIYVDGRLATVLSSTPIITKVRVTEKADMHLFELKKAGENLDCKKGLLITQDNQKVTFNCN